VYLAEQTGEGIRIAVIDSGVHASHPHVRGIAGGIAVREDGTLHEDYVDRLGHGTAVTAAICEKAPNAEILAIKVFWRALSTDIATLVRAIDEAADRGASVINLSLGTARMEHRELLEAAVARARAKGALIVAAHDDGGVRWLPGCLEHVVAVRADWACERDAYGIEFVEDRPMLSTSPYPRGIPGVSRERNLNGVSFAVANAAGFVARALEQTRQGPGPNLADIAKLFVTLEEACPEHAAHSSTLRRTQGRPEPGRGTTGS
jgi:subtilisin family serine protease